MTPLARLLSRALERLLGRWREGPEPPRRLEEMVAVFANLHPRATRAEWAAFAAGHAASAYLAGYQRGVEHVERTWDPPPAGRVEALADRLDPGWRDREHDWRWAPDEVLEDPGWVVEEPHDER